MVKKILISLFYAPSSCSGGGCGCACGGSGGGGPAWEVGVFSDLAEKMAMKFGEARLEFEAYGSLDRVRFPVLAGAVNPQGKLEAPVVTVEDTILSKGRMPSAQELEAKLRALLSLAGD